MAIKIRHKSHHMNPNSLKNLRPFKKGTIPNPAGRPTKDVSLTSLLKEEIEKVGDDREHSEADGN